MKKEEKTVLITGANSGIGFEASILFAKKGYGKIILGTRTLAKGEDTIRQLKEKGIDGEFDIVTLDTSSPESGRKAADELMTKGYHLDVLVLNAGMSPGVLERNALGVDLTFASTLLGHHALTNRLLSHGAINRGGRIIIAGSESARGDLPGMAIPNLEQIARDQYQNNITRLLDDYFTGSYPRKYDPMKAYAVAKLFVAWWSTALASKLPQGITVNTVSPGSAPGTSFARNQNWFMRNVMINVMKILGPLMGAAGSTTEAAQRYVDAADFDESVNGKFYASPAGKLVGKIEEQKVKLLENIEFRDFAFELITKYAEEEDLAVV